MGAWPRGQPVSGCAEWKTQPHCSCCKPPPRPRPPPSSCYDDAVCKIARRPPKRPRLSSSSQSRRRTRGACWPIFNDEIIIGNFGNGTQYFDIVPSLGQGKK